MKKLLPGLLVTFLACSQVSAQNTIQLHSITTNRQPTGDNGYTLNGSQMVNSRQKLLNTGNFGTGGTYPKQIVITDGYLASGSLQNITSTPGIDLFYFGIFNSANTSLVPFTAAELDSLHAWSVRGGKLIIGSGAPQPSFPFIPDILNSRWGFDMTLQYPTNLYPTAPGTASTLFNGPFGTLPWAFQGGSSQGYFSSGPVDVVVLADDGAGNPTMYLDCATLDLVVGDGDVYTGLGNISPGNTITTPNDILWANTIAYMDALQDPPVITQAGNLLSTGTYSSYQWYLNGNPIAGATASSYAATQAGNYTVSVALSCGCTNVASQAVTIVGVDEIADKSSIVVSPNPAGPGGINFLGVTRPMTVRAYSADGKLADEFTVDARQQHYSTDHLRQGVYFLRMLDEQGRPASVQKLVIE